MNRLGVHTQESEYQVGSWEIGYLGRERQINLRDIWRGYMETMQWKLHKMYEGYSDEAYK